MGEIKKRREYFVSTADKNYYYNEDNDLQDIPVSYCQRCLEFGFNNPLKERLYRKDELINGEKPVDFSEWVQCHTCGTLVHVTEAKQENEITPLRDSDTTTGYSSRKPTIEHFVPSRRININRKLKKPIKEKPEDTDMDVKPKVERGSKLVSYETSDR